MGDGMSWNTASSFETTLQSFQRGHWQRSCAMNVDHSVHWISVGDATCSCQAGNELRSPCASQPEALRDQPRTQGPESDSSGLQPNCNAGKDLYRNVMVQNNLLKPEGMCMWLYLQSPAVQTPAVPPGSNETSVSAALCTISGKAKQMAQASEMSLGYSEIVHALLSGWVEADNVAAPLQWSPH